MGPSPRRPAGGGLPLGLGRLRLRRRQLTRWAATALLVAVVAWAVVGTTRRADRARQRWGEQVEVVVAARTLEPGDVLDADAVHTRWWPRSLLPGDALRRLGGTRVVTSHIAAGEPVVAGRLGADGLRGVAGLLPPGTRALAVPADAAGVGVRVGDLVDVLVAPGLAGGAGGAATVARAATVVGVDDDRVAVAVTVDRVDDVAGALTTGTVVLALTSPAQ